MIPLENILLFSPKLLIYLSILVKIEVRIIEVQKYVEFFSCYDSREGDLVSFFKYISSADKLDYFLEAI